MEDLILPIDNLELLGLLLQMVIGIEPTYWGQIFVVDFTYTLESDYAKDFFEIFNIYFSSSSEKVIELAF